MVHQLGFHIQRGRRYCDYDKFWHGDGRYMWFASGSGDVTNCYSRSIPNCFYREFQYWYHLVCEDEFDSYGNRMWRTESYVNVIMT